VIHDFGNGGQWSFLRFLIFTWSREWGTWWVGIWRFRIILRAPWNEPLFSERYGHTKTLKVGRGWRVAVRMVPTY
jgi:hypothetical protein